MKKQTTLVAATPAIFAAAALLLSFRFPNRTGEFIAYGGVIIIGAIMALEYRLNWKGLLDR